MVREIVFGIYIFGSSDSFSQLDGVLWGFGVGISICFGSGEKVFWFKRGFGFIKSKF